MSTDSKSASNTRGEARAGVRTRDAGGQPRVLFLYNHTYGHEVQAHRRGEVPAHRLFGLAQMHLFGYQALMCPEPPHFRRSYGALSWRAYQALYAALHQRGLAAIVATHEASALPVLILKKLGLLRAPVVVINIALLQPANCSGKRGALWKWCLPAADAISSYASAQLPWLAEEFGLPPSRLAFTPLGVDTQFFAPEPLPAPQVLEDGESFCLSVGTNEGKDFATLIEALPPGVRLEIYTDEANALAIKDLASRNPLVAVHFEGTPITQLRELYRRARFMVLPLREARYSSGQTVLLENMALGRPIIASSTSGVRDYIGPTVTLVEPGSVQAMRSALQQAWAAPSPTAEEQQRASEAVREWSCEEFARRLAQIIDRVARPGRAR